MMNNEPSDWKLNQSQQQMRGNWSNQNQAQQPQSDFSTANRAKASWGTGLGSSWSSFNRDTHNEKQESWPAQETFEQNAQRLYGGKSNSGSYKNYGADSLRQNEDFE